MKHKDLQTTFIFVYFLFIYFKYIWDILAGKLVLIKCPQMFTGPVGPVEVLFYWPKAIFGNFYWPGAIGPLLASSPEEVP